MRRAIVLVIAWIPIALALSCRENAGEPEKPRTPEAFLDTLSSVYSFQDSIRYESLLDSQYWFELLPDDFVPDSASGWNRSAELRIAGRMFRASYSPDRVRLRSLSLALGLKAMEIDTAAYEGKAPGETWYRMTASVDLVAVVEDPEASDGSGYVNYTVNSDQVFVLRPDPHDQDRFLIVRQIDRPPPWIGKGRSGTVDINWGALKEIWW